MNENAKISIIIPVYNVEDYLPQCIDSILIQSYKNIEIILVDDGSTDASGRICDDYAKSDNRICVIHTKNGGQSRARNIGIDSAKGEYITFVDADDTITTDYIATLFTLLKAHNADVAMATHDSFGRLSRQLFAPATIITDGIGATERMLYQCFFDSCMVCKIFKRDILVKFKHTENIIYEDLELLSRILPAVDKVVWSKKIIYHYRKRIDSSIMSFSTKQFDALKVTEMIEERAKNQYPMLMKAARERRLSANFNIFSRLAVNGLSNSAEADACWLNIKSLRLGSLTNRKVRLKTKAGIMLSMLGRNVFTLICRI